MLRKTLVILRALFVIGPIIFIFVMGGADPLGISVIFGGIQILVVFLAFTTWIDSIDSRSQGSTPAMPKTEKIIGIVASLISVAAIIYLVSIASTW